MQYYAKIGSRKRASSSTGRRCGIVALVLLYLPLSSFAWDAGRCPWDDKPWCQQQIYFHSPNTTLKTLMKSTNIGGQTFRSKTRVDKSFPRGNTHLFILNQAISLIKSDPETKAIGEALEHPDCKPALDFGIYLIDEEPHVDSNRLGSHFYNPGIKDYRGVFESCHTFRGGDDAKNIANYALSTLAGSPTGACNVSYGTARSNAQLYLGQLARANMYFAKTKAHAKKLPEIRAVQCASLGQALHYFTDITNPMHSKGFSGSSTPLATIASEGKYGLHPYYENWIGTQHSPRWEAKPNEWRATKNKAETVLSGTYVTLSAAKLNKLYKSPDWVLVKAASESGQYFKRMMSSIFRVAAPAAMTPLTVKSKQMKAAFAQSLPTLDDVMRAARKNTASYIVAAIRSTQTHVDMRTKGFVPANWTP